MATITIGNSYRFKDYNNNKYLNILTDGMPSNNTNVTIYSLDSSDMAQVWKCESYTNSNLGVSGVLMKSVKNSNVALDRWRGSSNFNNADVYAIGTTAAELQDQLVEFILLSNGYYRIKLAYYDLYLTVSSTTTYGGYNVNWQALTGNTNQLWAAELYGYSGSSSIFTTAPAEIINQTFFVKNYNTGYNLNVHGTETVADGRNVNVYAKENCLAQKWVVRQEPDGAKLFTKLREDVGYALNINTSNNNCTMYTENSNTSADSVLEFIPYTTSTITADDKVYRIKMANHNKYLDVESTGNGANAYWVSGTSGYSLWQFVTEETMFPYIPSSPKVDDSITNKTFAVKADGTDFNLNVSVYEEINDGRNVNIYNKEDCNAQRWFIANTVNGAKLYSTLEEDVGYALNIDTDNNCTIKHASSNDMNSLLEFEFIGFMKCRIKMFNHNKYLAVEKTVESGANVIWVDGIGNATIWKLVPAGSEFPNITNRRVFLGNIYDLFEIVLRDTFSTKNDFINAALYAEVSTQPKTIVNTPDITVKASLKTIPQFIDNSSYPAFFTLEQEYNGTTNPTRIIMGGQRISVAKDLEEIISDNFSVEDIMNDLAVTLGFGEYSFRVTTYGLNHFKIEVIRNIPNRPDNPELELGFGCSITLDVEIHNDGLSVKLPAFDFDYNIRTIFVGAIILYTMWRTGMLKTLIEILISLAGTDFGKVFFQKALT